MSNAVKLDKLIIAVDGPAAAGKGTLARKLAEVLHLPYFDTGLLYRAIARKMLDEGMDPVEHSGMPYAQGLKPQDLQRKDLRTPDVDQAASKVAAQAQVRAALIDVQRRFGLEKGGVLDGRDIGTVIFPQAPVKLFIHASPHTRAYRRWLQNGGSLSDPAHKQQIAQMAKDLEQRDLADSMRAIAPLKAAADAVVISTDDLSAQQVFEKALAIIHAAWPLHNA